MGSCGGVGWAAVGGVIFLFHDLAVSSEVLPIHSLLESVDRFDADVIINIICMTLSLT